MDSQHSIGTYEDSNGFKVRANGIAFVGWVYPMGYIEGMEDAWGAISSVGEDVSDPTLYCEGMPDKHIAAAWLANRAAPH